MICEISRYDDFYIIILIFVEFFIYLFIFK